MGNPSIRTGTCRPAAAAVESRRFDSVEIDRSPHGIERQIRQVLTSHPGLTVSSLVVRRLGDGVCLSGVVESMDGDTDVCDIVREFAGVEKVVNRLLVRSGFSG